MIPNAVKANTLIIAKSKMNLDTGNARHNAIRKTKDKENSYTINYSLYDAFYIHFLEEGTKKMKAHKPVYKAYITIARYLRDYYGGNKKRHWKNVRARNVYEVGKDGNIGMRSFRHSQSPEGYQRLLSKLKEND